MRELRPTAKPPEVPIVTPAVPKVRYRIEFDALVVDETSEADGWWAEYQDYHNSDDFDGSSFEDYLTKQIQSFIDDDPYDIYIEWYEVIGRLLKAGPRLFLEVDMNGAEIPKEDEQK